MNKYLLLTFLFLLIIPATTWPQQKDFIFKNFTQEEGLPSNETYFIFEDSRKYLWIATDLGVARYDGNKFQVYSLPDNVVFKIKEDHKGRIWFFSHTGLLAYFEKEKIHPYRYNHIIQQRIQKLHINDAWIDSSENIYLSSGLDSNYIFYNNGNIAAANHNYYGKQTVKINIKLLNKNTCFAERVLSSHSYGDSILLVIKEGGKSTEYPLSLKYHSFTQYGAVTNEKGDIYFFGDNMIIKLRQDGTSTTKRLNNIIVSLLYQKGKLWAGMRGGVIQLDEDLLEVNTGIVLPGKTISSTCIDYEGGLWFSTTENGIYYARNTSIRNITFDKNSPGIDRLFNYRDSFLIYTNHTGLYKFNNSISEALMQFENIGVSYLAMPNEKHLFLFGSYGSNEAWHFKNNKLPFPYIHFFPTARGVAFTNQNNFFLSTSSHTLYVRMKYEADTIIFYFVKRNRKTKKDSNLEIVLNKPSTPFFDKTKIAWAACNDGLYKSTAPYDTFLKTGLSNPVFEKGISNIAQLDAGWIAAGIRSGGIAIFTNPDTSINITEADGLLSNKIKYLLPVKNQLWAATAKGISVIIFSSFNPVSYRIANIGKSDGLYNTTINQLIQYKGTIAAASRNGIYFIETPDIFLDRKLPVIPFFINNINYYKGDTVGISTITLPYAKSRMVIKYSAVSFNGHEKLQYLYRFAQNDTAWHNTTNTERLVENLSPGTYTLQLRASIPELQRYSEIKTITIIIEKPWWQNNWLRLLLIILTACGIYLLVSKRIKRIQAEEKRKTDLNAKLAELEQTALRSQMNPHFIFNCLTSIQQLIITGDKVEANEYLVKFARLIRKTLELSAHPFISVNEEKQYLEEYLILEQLRLSGRFDFNIISDNSIDTSFTLIPNMMIQPVVENCIRHGIKPLETRKGMITVHFKQINKIIACTITDNGVGRSSISESKVSFTEHKSYGIDIVRKRLEVFAENNTEESGIEIIDLFDDNENPAGTQVILNLPYKNII